MSTAESPVLVEIDGSIATITLNRPSALNAITVDMLDDLGDALTSLHGRQDIAVVVLTGAGRAFSAGVDLLALGGRSLVGGAVGDLLDLPGRRVIALIENLDAIVIAKVNGFCFTGALELALACDLIVTADEAVFGDTHAKWGLRPSWGMSQRLPALVGPATARLLSYRGQQPRRRHGLQGPLPRGRTPERARRTRVRGIDRLPDRRHRGANRPVQVTPAGTVCRIQTNTPSISPFAPQDVTNGGRGVSVSGGRWPFRRP